MKASYDPQFQSESAPWMPWALDRKQYEALCHECGVMPMSDGAILDNEYALRYAGFTQTEWLRKSREERVLFQLNARRLHKMDGDSDNDDDTENDEDAWDDAEDMMICPRCHNEFPRKQRMMSAIGAVCPDCYDEASF